MKTCSICPYADSAGYDVCYITRDAYVDFFYELQRGVLLSLKEEGKLNEMQYRHAEEALKEQRRVIIRARIEGGSTS